MICPNCSREGRGKFCTNCGARLEEETGAQGEVAATSAIPSDALRALQESQRPSGATDMGAASTQYVPPQPSGSDEPPSQQPSSPPLQGVLPSSQRVPDDSTRDAGWVGGARQSFSAFAADSGAGPEMGRPMTFGQIVSGTFEILQTRMTRFLGVAVAYTAAMFVAFVIFLIALAAAGASSILAGDLGSALFSFLIGGLVFLVVSVVAGAVAACAYIHIARESNTGVGDDLVGSTIETLRRAWASAPRLILALLVLVGLWIVLAIVAALLGTMLGPLRFLVSLATLVVGIWLGVSFSFVPQAAVIDRADPVGALRASMDLVSGYWWRTAGYWVVAAGIALGFSIVGFIVLAILGIILSHIPILGIVVTSLLDSAIIAAIYAFYITYGTLMYFDLKARKAGVPQAASPVPGV